MNQTSNPNILIVEDNLPTANLEKAILETAGYVVETLDTGQAALKRIADGGLDLILLDNQLPDMMGSDIVKALGDQIQDLPVIMITGHGDERLAVELLKQGVADYLVKGTPNFVHILTATVKSAIERSRMSADRRNLENQLRESEEIFRRTFQAIPDPAFLCLKQDGDIVLSQINRSGVELIGQTESRLVGQTMSALLPGYSHILETIQKSFTTEEPIHDERQERFFSAEERWFALDYVRFKDSGVLLIVKDITERKRAESALKYSHDLLERKVYERTAELSTTNEKLKIEIAERLRAEEVLRRHLALEEVIAGMSSQFVASRDVDQVIRQSLDNLTEASGASRICMLRFEEGLERVRAAYAWTNSACQAPDIDPDKIATHNYPWAMSRLKAGENINIPDVSRLPAEASAERQLLEDLKTKSLLALPFYVNGSLSGFIGYDHTEKTGVWSDDDAVILKTASEIIGYALEAMESREKVAESEEKYRNLVERAHDGIAIIQGGLIRYINPRLSEIFSYDSTEVLMQPIETIFVPEESVKVRDYFSQKEDDQSPLTFESFMLPKNGTKIEVECNSGFITFIGKPAHMVFIRDVTERRHLETQLRHAQKMESIGTLAAGIAHEINTPTQFVGDNLQFLGDSFKDILDLIGKYDELLATVESGATASVLAPEIREAVSKADLDFLKEEIPRAIVQSKDGVKRVADIVRAMKEFSHPGPDEKVSVDMNRAIANTVIVARNEWKYVADLETELDPDLPLVNGLPGDLNQVILNIIVNASHAIADIVGDGSKGKGKIRITTSQSEGNVEIRISDTGGGIPAAVQSRIFDPFFTTKPVGKGTGQGLAIAHSVIADKHNGTITFETIEGKGTTFIIRLPQLQNQTSP